MFPFLSRFQSTLLIGLLSIAIIFVARCAADFVTAIVTFATLIIVCTTPWVVIMTIGYITRRGYYRPDDLQLFNRRRKSGACWFTRGVNYRGMAAWIPAAVLGLLFVNIPGQFEGPLKDVAADLGFDRLTGVDISLLVAIILAALLYVLFLALSPEPRAVYGPDGPCLVHGQGRRDATDQGRPR